MAIKYKIEGIRLDNTPVTIWDDFLKEDPVITKVSIDILPPFVSITNPAEGQVITLSDDVNVTGTAQDDFQVARVETSLDGGAWVEAANTSGGSSVTSWLRSYVDIPNGTHTVKARAFDTAGLQSTEASTSFTMNIPPPPDIIPPTITITTPVGGSTVTGDSTRTVTVAGTAFDSESGVSRVEVGLDGFAMVVATGTTSWSKVFTGVPDGSRVITARAFDTAGNVSPITTSSFNMLATVPPDTAIPLVTITTPVLGATVVYTALPFTINVAGTVSDDISVTRIEVQARWPDQSPPVGGPIVIKTINSLPGQTVNWSATIQVPDVRYTRILVYAYDSNNRALVINDVSYTLSPPPDTTAPTVNISTPPSASTVTSSTVMITGTASDGTGGSGVAAVEVGLDGQTMKLASGTTSWSYQFTGVPAGNRVITTRARDNAGNWSAIKTSSFTVSIISPPPPPPPPTTGLPPPSPLVWPTAAAAALAGCPVFAVSSYVVTVSKSGSTITAKGSDGVTKHSGAYTSSAGWASPALNAAISAANAKTGGGTVHVNAGEFLTYADVNMKNNVIIEGEGQIDPVTKTTLTKLTCTKNQGKILVAGDRTNIGVRNITLDGANIAVKVVDFHSCTGVFIHGSILERHNGYQPGVYIGEVTNCTVFNTISRNHLGKGDKLAVGGRNVRILSCDLYGTVHENGSITSGGIETGEVAYNYVHDTWTYAGTSFENQSFNTTNVDVHHNTYKNLTNDGNTILFVTQISPESPAIRKFDKIWIHHNDITNCQGSGIQSRMGRVISNLKIYDNTMNGVNYDGIRVGPVKTCIIDRNTINGNKSYGVRIQPPAPGYPISDDVKIGSTAANANTITNMDKGPTSIAPGSTNVWINGIKKS